MKDKTLKRRMMVSEVAFERPAISIAWANKKLKWLLSSSFSATHSSPEANYPSNGVSSRIHHIVVGEILTK